MAEQTFDEQIRRDVAHLSHRVEHILAWAPTQDELEDLKQEMLTDMWGVWWRSD
jgi:hypothetical protein